jgi:hypothetical protein
MQTARSAFAWEFFQRHRTYVLVLAGYLLVLGLIKPVFLGPEATVRFDPPDGFAAFAVVPFTVTFFYLIGVFTFGLTGDLAARQSIYPARLFTLPVSTAALAGWPMLYGCVSMLGLWATAAVIGRWPWGIALPWLWPGLVAAVVLAWIQVFTWMPYGVRGIRVIAAVFVLIALDALVFTAIELEWPERALVAGLAPQLPLAYLCAWVAVAKARRGDAPGWSWSRRATARAAIRLPPFRSKAIAQLWFEWRRHGWTLPALVALVVPFELSVLFISGYGSHTFVAKVLGAVLLTPILMAAFAAAAVSKANPFARDVYGVSAFASTRPLATAQMIAAKLQMAALSTAVAWLYVLIVGAAGFIWSGADSVVADWTLAFTNRVGPARATVALLLILGALVTLTWTMLVQGLFIGLTGRQWLARIIGLVTLAAIMAIGPLLEWIGDRVDVQRWLFDWWVLVPAALVAIKTAAATFVASRLSRTRLVVDHVLVAGAAAWLVLVVAAYAAMVWWLDTALIPGYIPALLAILAVPLVRVSAAPLALDWNRHR